jgi:ribonuclease R
MRRKKFTIEVLEAARKEVFSLENLAKRPLVSGITVDDRTSRDLDDAIWVESTPENYQILVSIADVASLVRLDSLLDEEAFLRAFTRYRDWGCYPMIPFALSEDKLSLLPQHQRPTLTISVTMDKQGNILETALEKTCLLSQKRYDYEEISREIQEDENSFLREWYFLALKLLEKRQKAGAFVFFDPSHQFYLDEDLNLNSVQNHGQVLIQELMILANQALAQKMAQTSYPFLFRNHQGNLPESREELLQSFQKILNGTSVEEISQIRFSQERARYGASSKGHFALNLSYYTHFTSPIRRYADLVVHRIVHAFLEGKESPYSLETLENIAEHLNQQIDEERDARKNDYEIQELKKAQKILKTASDLELEAFLHEDTYRFLKAVLSLPTPREPILELLTHSLEKDLWSVKALLLLFTDPSKKNLAFKKILQEKALIALAKKPERALSLLNSLKQSSEFWANYQFLTSSTGSSHQPLYQSRLAVLTPENSWTTSEYAQASHKAKAEQEATLLFFKNYLAHTLRTAVDEDFAVLVEKNPQDPLALLNEMKQRYSWPSFQQLTLQLTPPPNSSFQTKISLKDPPFSEAVEILGEKAPTKKEAERQAALVFLQKLQEASG